MQNPIRFAVMTIECNLRYQIYWLMFKVYLVLEQKTLLFYPDMRACHLKT